MHTLVGPLGRAARISRLLPAEDMRANASAARLCVRNAETLRGLFLRPVRAAYVCVCVREDGLPCAPRSLLSNPCLLCFALLYLVLSILLPLPTTAIL